MLEPEELLFQVLSPMRPCQARCLLAWPLVVAVALAGCATGDKPRTLRTTERAVVPPAIRTPPADQPEGVGSLWRRKPVQVDESYSAKDSRPLGPSPIQLASYAQDSPPRPLAPSPAEVIVAPDAGRLDHDRPELPLDLATALAMTQGQNPRVAFAQAQIAQSLAAHDAA